MKVMSFNTQHCLNYVEQVIDFDLMARTVLDLDADIIGLNEMRGEGTHRDYTAQTEKLSELTGIGNYYFAKAIDVPGGGPYGNGLLSKIPIVSAETVPVPDPEEKLVPGGYYESRCLLKARLEGGITVLVIHFGLNPDEQINAVNTVVANLEDEKCILMGDFNVLPTDKVLDPIRKRMTDTADLFGSELYSFPSDDPTRKIDYMFVSKDLCVKWADIPAIVASDHRPYIAEIE